MSVNCPSPQIQPHPVIPLLHHSRQRTPRNQHIAQAHRPSRYSKPFTPARSVTPSPRQLEYSLDAPKHPNTPADTAHDLSPPRSPVNNQDNVIANDYSSLLPPSRDINYHHTTSAGIFTSSTRTLIVSTGTTLHNRILPRTRT